MNRVMLGRAALCAPFLLLLAAASWRLPRAAPAEETDPNELWRVGTFDHSSDEFGLRREGPVRFSPSRGANPRDWPRQHRAGAAGYVLAFDLARAEPVVLAVDAYSTGVAPWALEVAVNGAVGRAAVPLEIGTDRDERQANFITYTRHPLRVAIPARLLRAGRNEFELRWIGDEAVVDYDALRLERAASAPLAVDGLLRPTVFYKRRGAGLVEEAEIVIRHQQPLDGSTILLEVAGRRVPVEAAADGAEFGERAIRVEVPAMTAPTPYRLSVQGKEFRGTFTPERRWRIFASLKIHNDIGFTDLQQNVEELDTRNADALLRLLDKHPFYKFTLETTWLVDNYLQSRTEPLRKKLLGMARQGRIGVSAAYLNMMTGTSTGEELYRMLYYARRLEEQHGVPMRFATLTDAPSHSWFVPTLLDDAGIRGFANGSNQSRAPILQNSRLNETSPFYWEGPDGSRVLTWLARTYLQFHRLAGEKPTLDRLRRTVPQFLTRFRRPDYVPDAVLLYGLYTDNAEIRDGEAEAMAAWNREYAFPSIEPATESEYFDYVAAKFGSKLPVYRGDGGAYWEDGVASTAAEFALNRGTQHLLPSAEMVNAITAMLDPGIAYPKAELKDAWENLLFFDEHTWGAYHSISQPGREDVERQWEFKRAYALSARWAATNLLTRGLNRLAQSITIDGPTLLVLNPNVWERTDVVECELDGNRELVDLSTGAVVPLDVVSGQRDYSRVRFLAAAVPGLGYKAYGIRPAVERAASETPPESRDWTADGKFYRLRFDPSSGAITEIFDKELGRNLVEGEGANRLLRVTGGAGSRIIMDMTHLPPPKLEVSGASKARLIENARTVLGRRVRIRAEAPGVPSIESEIQLYDHAKRIDIVNRLRKDESTEKEAVYFAFPFRAASPEVRYQIQNAWVRPDADQLPGAGREWFTTQNVIVVRDSGAAVAWATPDAPLVTLGDINRGRWPRRADIRNGHVYSYIMNNYWFTNYRAAQGGDVVFRYSIASARSLDESRLAQFDSDTRGRLYPSFYDNTPTVRLGPRQGRFPLAAGAFLKVGGTGARLSAFKQAESGQGYIIRLQEITGEDGEVEISAAHQPVAAAWLCNGVEKDLRPLAVRNGAVRAPLRARRYTTVRLVFPEATGNAL